MPKHHYHASDVCSYDSSSSEELYTRIPRQHTRHGSVVSSHHHHHVHSPPPTAYGGANLAVPVVDVGGRKRASSTSGMPQPNIIINAGDTSRSHSRERARPRSRSRTRYYDDDDSSIVEYVERRGRLSRSPSLYGAPVDYETAKALERLKIYEKEKAEEEAQKKYKAEMEIKKAKEQLEKAEAEKKEKELAKKAVEDWQREEDAKKAKAKKEKEEQDKAVEDRIRQELIDRRWTSAEIEAFLKKDKADKKASRNEWQLDSLRPTYIKVHKKYLLPETLDVYRLPWDYDSVSWLPTRIRRR
jgi:hypothetical protein